MAINFSNSDTECPKQAWVLETLALEEATAGSVRTTELKQHLSVCSSCHSLASRMGPVTKGLAGLALLGPSTALIDKSMAQASRALQSGGQYTGRVDIPTGHDGPLRHVWPWAKIGVFAAATIVIIAFGAMWLSGYKRAKEKAYHMEHRSAAKNLQSLIPQPWPAFGQRSARDIDRAADIDSGANRHIQPGQQADLALPR